ncbi:MAG: DNA cytosine methyltransferase, partial [Clostridia bacterium]|nr:DNA cytosine methyltransferase [Clostridia bacterium]
MTVGEYLNKARNQQQISIRRLAALTGISHSEINKIENGERTAPSALHLKSIADILGINQIDLFKVAGYIDNDVYTVPANFAFKYDGLSDDEVVQVQSYIDSIRSKHPESDKTAETNEKKNIKVASLFAGIGGICYGFKQAGADVVWANELDKDACKTYRKNFGGDYLVEGDIKEIDPHDIPDIDILNGGFPCQAFSVAGYR